MNMTLSYENATFKHKTYLMVLNSFSHQKIYFGDIKYIDFFLIFFIVR